MSDFDWLRDRLVAALKWQIANPGTATGHDDPVVPMAGYRVWNIFTALHAAREVGFGPSPITHEAMEAHARLTRTPLRPFEVEIIQALDRAYLEAVAEKRGDGKKQEVSSRPMSVALFDAVFG
ncbi:MAG: hypothetical protein AB7O60_14075 [Variibacter sp.]